jgi:hypothetical protein
MCALFPSIYPNPFFHPSLHLQLRIRSWTRKQFLYIDWRAPSHPQPSLRSQLLRAQWGAGPDDVVILSIGRLSPEKNLECVEFFVSLNSFSAIYFSFPPFRFLLFPDCVTSTLEFIHPFI